jgi:hypothetical protein
MCREAQHKRELKSWQAERTRFALANACEAGAVLNRGTHGLDNLGSPLVLSVRFTASTHPGVFCFLRQLRLASHNPQQCPSTSQFRCHTRSQPSSFRSMQATQDGPSPGYWISSSVMSAACELSLPPRSRSSEFQEPAAPVHPTPPRHAVQTPINPQTLFPIAAEAK